MNEQIIIDLSNGTDLFDFANKYCNGDTKLAGSKIKELENIGFNIHRKINDNGEIGYILSSTSWH